MGMATHLGPWLLGTQKNSGVVAGVTVTRDMGATEVAQSYTIDRSLGTTGTICTLPAGALIVNTQLATSTVFSSATSITLKANGVALNSTPAPLATTNPSITNTTLNFDNTSFTNNVGTSDVSITYLLSGTATSGKCTVTIWYVVRNPDGSVVPTSYTS